MRNVSTAKAGLFLLGLLGVVLVMRSGGAKGDPKLPDPKDPGPGGTAPGDPLPGPVVTGPAAAARIGDVLYVGVNGEMARVLAQHVAPDGDNLPVYILVQLDGRQGALLTGYIIGYGLFDGTVEQLYPPAAMPPFAASYVTRVDRAGKQIA